MKQALVEQIKGRDNLFEKPKNVLQGRVGNFPVYVRQGIDGTAFWKVAVYAKEGSTLPAYQMDSFLTELRSGIKKVTKTSFDGKRIEIVVRNSGKVGLQIREVLDIDPADHRKEILRDGVRRSTGRSEKIGFLQSRFFSYYGVSGKTRRYVYFYTYF